jgi:16S rRNA (uracil1498-N3)-methyltransferase
MPATPAWPTSSLPRLFVGAGLGAGVAIALDSGQANYLGNVLRLGVGGEVLLFDGVSGEWLARIAEAGKKRMTLTVERRTREIERVPELTLAFAPVKRAPLDWLVEKATELGVARLQPVITRRTVVERVKLERLEAITVEAAEQCGRTLLPAIAEPMALPAFLGTLNAPLYFADETGGEPVHAVMKPGAATILTGPEGGFTPEERALIRAHPMASGITLGPRILRAETAALAAVSAYMALAGDWR